MQVAEAPVASRTSEFAELKRQLDAADADIELVNKRLDEAQGKCYLLENVAENKNFPTRFTKII